MGSMERGVPVKILAMISDRSGMQAALPHLPQRIFRLTSAVGVARMIVQVAVKEVQPVMVQRS